MSLLARFRRAELAPLLWLRFRRAELAPLLCALLLVAALPVRATSALLQGDPPALKAGVFDPARMAPEFTLQGSNGEELSLRQFRGKVVLLGFGFTSCTEVCPITLGTLAQARKQLGALADQVQVIYITVDPERDDAAQLQRYLGAFDPDFLGGTGSVEALAAIRRDYGILAERRANTDGDFSHSSFVYLIDRQGSLRALMTYGREPKDYVHDVRVLLGEP